jgi:molybdate transport system ATP-binding protein
VGEVKKTAPSSQGAEPFISVNDISIRLYDRTVFEHTRWEILSDQHWAVIGPNGSGKSTLTKALCGQIPITKGEIVYHFARHSAHPTRSKRATWPQDHIAYVAFDTQETALEMRSRRGSSFHQARWNSGVSEETLSVSAHLSERRIKRLNPYAVIEERAGPATFQVHRDEVIERLEIGALLERSLIQLSNGERRKMFIAQALLRNPKLLILDNPFTGLDEHFRARLKNIIQRLVRDDMRVMLVTAGREEIPAGITHVLLVENSQVVVQGPKEEAWSTASARRIAHPGRSAELEFNLAGDTRVENRGTKDQILVQMDGVNVSYNGVTVLTQVDWTVQRGENWALLGPNGSGKTTLLSLILGDNPQAYANNITLFGRRRGSGESIWEIKKHIGWVSSELHLYYPKAISCLDVVCSGFFDSVGLYRKCSPQQREIARLWMRQLDISEQVDVPFGKLSEGEQRMVLIARALVKHPPLLILDEPCQGLDAGNRDRVLQTIDALGNYLETSVIYVTHDPDELPRIITHVMRLDRGRVIDKARVISQ